MVILRLEFEDLQKDCKYRPKETLEIKASNIFMLVRKFLQVESKRNIFIEYYHLETPKIEAGNQGRNAGAYLYDVLGSLTGNRL